MTISQLHGISFEAKTRHDAKAMTNRFAGKGAWLSLLNAQSTLKAALRHSIARASMEPPDRSEPATNSPRQEACGFAMPFANRPMPHDASDVAASATNDGQWFTTTHWSVVLSTGQSNSSQVSEALEKLCRSYWPPSYSYVRRQGFGPEDAQDLTQAFFAKLLEKNFWARADPQKGRFRSFLLTALRQFLSDQRDRAKTAKRGGGVSLISFDERSGEDFFLEGLNQNVSAEQQFERQWAAAVLEQARAKLRQECITSGKSGLFDCANLLGDKHEKSFTYADIAKQLGMSVSAIKSAVLRMRERYGELVREEVAHTVSSPAEVDAEIRYLLSVISS